MEAIRKVVDSFDRAQTRPHEDNSIVLLATLDVHNAFNSARWVDILKAFSDDFALPFYLLWVLKDCLKDRYIMNGTQTGSKTRRLTAGVAQGSILGLKIWNVLFDEVPDFLVPPRVYFVAYADDLIVAIVTKNTRLAQMRLIQAMKRV